jgi:hypothetical protein
MLVDALGCNPLAGGGIAIVVVSPGVNASKPVFSENVSLTDELIEYLLSKK